MSSGADRLFIGPSRRAAYVGILLAFVASAHFATECRAGVIVPAPRDTIAEAELGIGADALLDDGGSPTRLDALVSSLRERSKPESPPVRRRPSGGFFESSEGTSSPLVSATGQTNFMACAGFESQAPVGANSHFTGRLSESALLVPEAPCQEMLDPPRT